MFIADLLLSIIVMELNFFSRDLPMSLNGCVLLVCLLPGAEVLSHFVKSAWASVLDGHCTSTDNKAEVNTGSRGTLC